MSINLNRLSKLDNDETIKWYIAQANARYILLNTKEKSDNFPAYSINDDKLILLAFYYLELGCWLLEEDNNSKKALESIEKWASILEHTYAASQNKSPISKYYLLIAALAYYLCFQYSKAFILIQKIPKETPIAYLIAAFLKKDYTELLNEICKIVTDNSYSDENLAGSENSSDSERKIYELMLSKILNGFVNYFFTGELKYLSDSQKILNNLREISKIKSEPDMWWIFRLMQLIWMGINEASLWNNLNIHLNSSDEKVVKYIHSLAYLDTAICELFLTQRSSLSMVLDRQKKGCVVNIPTSSWKTRIAEIAILENKINNPDTKVLYIAPFRSLAYEVESALEKALGQSNVKISHLYGWGLFNKLDTEAIDSSDVIIATPEKAKAMLRTNDEILSKIKLVIIDEWHLLWEDKRLTMNEMFYEELRFFIENNNWRFVLLSAVLPNAEELSLWLMGTEETIFRETWRPSDERLWILEWDGRAVHLKWQNTDIERESFNRNFIISRELPLQKRQQKIRRVPDNLNWAIARTAYELWVFWPVLIFVGLKDSVFVMAQEFLSCIKEEEKNFIWWNTNDWRAFELACIEAYWEWADNLWLTYAKMWILCHHWGLSTDVRLPLERLMRSGRPRVIICTSTLWQGVNLGVSTVIFQTIYQAWSQVSHRDFWNIAGRAWRAFVDYEGKILVSLDTVQTNTNLEWKINWKRRAIKNYFDKSKMDNARSWLLSLLRKLKIFSVEQGIAFDTLLWLISENQIPQLTETAYQFELIDDTLLALHYANNTETDWDYSWIDTFFRRSLAYIQTLGLDENNLESEEFIKFITARTKGIVKKIWTEKEKWISLIQSGIPLNSDIMLEEKLSIILDVIEQYKITEWTISDKIELLKNIEWAISELPILIDYNAIPTDTNLDAIRTAWLSGDSLASITNYSEELKNKLVNSFYSFELPWILNGIAKKLLLTSNNEESQIIEELSILTEVWLPDIIAVRIYQCGIRSRTSAKELSDLFQDKLLNKNISYIKYFLIEGDFSGTEISTITLEWIKLLSVFSAKKTKKINAIPNFRTTNFHQNANTMIVKQVSWEIYMMSPDLSVIEKIDWTDNYFSEIYNVNWIYFIYNKNWGYWEMQNKNPHLDII